MSTLAKRKKKLKNGRKFNVSMGIKLHQDEVTVGNGGKFNVCLMKTIFLTSNIDELITNFYHVSQQEKRKIFCS